MSAYTAMLAALSLMAPVVANVVCMDTTELPGGDYTCQLMVAAGWITPGELKATDRETGKVLIDIPAGAKQTETKCINAPDGHALIVLHPAFGTQYEKAP